MSKLFIGNLAYSTTEDQLRDLVKSTCPTATAKVQLLTRRVVKRDADGNKPAATEDAAKREYVMISKGFAFATFGSEQEASTAQHALNGLELDGRPLKVEHANPPPATSPKKAATEEGGEEQPSRPRRRRNPAGATEAADQQTAEPKQPKQKREPREKSTTPSTTSVFVSNLPFSTTSDELTQFFTARHFHVKSAHVAQRTFRGTTRSKGFGFVEFESEQEQKRAVGDELAGALIGDREITVKIAMAKLEVAGGEQQA